MTAPTAPGLTVYVTLRELAISWRVSVPTARNRTRTPGFPPPFDAGKRSLRWPLEEVLTWEQSRRREVVRRVVTGKRPQHHVPAPRHEPVRVKVIRTVAP